MAVRKILTAVVLVLLLVGLSNLYERVSTSGKLSTLGASTDDTQQQPEHTDFEIAGGAKRIAMPNYTLSLVNGDTTTVDQVAKRGPVVLDFWEISCGYCRDEMPDLNRISAEYKAKGVTVICVNAGDAPGDIARFASLNKLGMPMASDIDAKIFRDLGFQGFPTTILIDKHGRAASLCMGYSENMGTELPKALDTLIAEP